jgi:succinylglutamic semialdehyde dehydrogenase
MDKPRFEFKAKGNFFDGQFVQPSDQNGEWASKSPADFSDVLGNFRYSYASIDDGVNSARHGFNTWRKTKIADRIDYLKKYQAALKNRGEEITEAIAREVGKPLWESKTELAAMMNKVDISISDSLRFVADYEVPNVMENTLGVTRYRPLGVMAVIGPFNFPGHLPNGHIVPALLTGNTVVFKPSEKAPLVGQLMAECFAEAGLPSGVFNLIQGEREVGRRLCVHEKVDAVLFTGSYEVGTRIKQDTLQQHWKLLALEMGGKNPAIVWNDSNLDHAIHETLTGAFLTAGQRCSATARIIVQNKILDQFISSFHDRAKAFSIGHPLDNPFMGPLVEQGSVDRYMKFLGIASREGCEIIMRGKAFEVSGVQGNYVTPSICWVKGASIESSRKSVYQQTEMFAPNVAILGVDTIDEAIAQANVTQFGLVTSVFTQNRKVFDHCLEDLQMGLVNWNKSTVGASSRLPFGGLKKSGNHFPTAVSASLYCTTPVASLEVAEPKLGSPSPGLNWK